MLQFILQGFTQLSFYQFLLSLPMRQFIWLDSNVTDGFLKKTMKYLQILFLSDFYIHFCAELRRVMRYTKH